MSSPLHAFQQTRLFSGLDSGHLEALLSRFSEKRYHDQEVLFHQGDNGDSLYLVSSGQVVIRKEILDGRSVTLALRPPGSVIGEMALIDGSQRSASAFAMGQVTVLSLARADFQSFLMEEPKICQRFLVILCQRLRESDQKIEDLGTKSVRQRLAGALLELAANEGRKTDRGVELSSRVNYQLLAGILCTNRESVSRACKDLQQSGAVARIGRNFLLCDLQGLADLYHLDA